MVDQVRAGGALMTLPNWSKTVGRPIAWLVARNIRSSRIDGLAAGRADAMLVSVGVTTTVLALLTERPPASMIFTAQGVRAGLGEGGRRVLRPHWCR